MEDARLGMDSENVSAILENAGWRRSHWYLFTAVSLNYLLDGVVFAIAPLIAAFAAPELTTLIFASNLLAESAGAILFGIIADKYGRKICLAAINAIQAVSTLMLFLMHTNPYAVWVFTSLLSLSVGGDFGASYAALAEIVPARYRGRAILLSTNFWNVGSAAIAGAAIVFSLVFLDPATVTQYVLLSALATFGLVAFIRLMVPESPRWLVKNGKADEALKTSMKIAGKTQTPAPKTSNQRTVEGGGGFLYRFTILAVVTVSQYVTYGMMAYYAPYARGFAFGVESASTVIFVANLGASIGAFLLIPLIDRNRKLSVLLSFAMGTAFAAVVYLTHEAADPLSFYTALFVCLVFSEWAWGAVSALQSELFPTGIRATVVGTLTALTGFSGAAIVLTQQILSANGFLATSVLIWAAGLAAAIAWTVKGVETANKTVEELETA